METICALATAYGRGGLNVIRISGDDAIGITARVFFSKNSISAAPSHTVVYGAAKDDGGNVIDRCLCSVFRAPKSFTGEDVCEISCHGGNLAASLIIDALLCAGARLASPGEFTKRAFINGKLSLTEAEAVRDVIDARTGAAYFAAVNRLGGATSEKINAVRDKLLYALASVQADCDYPDEDVYMDAAALAASLEEASSELGELCVSARRGELLRDGAKCAIIGAPNTGKSSLMNAIVESERAIVTEEAGTTRDVIEEYADVCGIPMRLGDTAGIREGAEKIERLGIERAKQYLSDADLCLFVTEAGRTLTGEEEKILDLLRGKDYIYVENKADLSPHKSDRADILVSARSRYGIRELKNLMAQRLGAAETNGAFVANARVREAVFSARRSVFSALDTLKAGLAVDLCSYALEEAVAFLGEADGQTVNDEVVDKIFSEFCLGK